MEKHRDNIKKSEGFYLHTFANSQCLEKIHQIGNQISDERGDRSLYEACERRYPTKDEKSNQDGAYVSSNSSQNSETLLFTACQNGEDSIVEELLEKKVDFKTTDKDRWSPIHIAAWKGHDKIVTALIKAGEDVDVTKPDDGWTPLHLACQKGHTVVVRTLIDYKSDIHHKDHNGMTPLIVASSSGHVEVVKVLLESLVVVDNIALYEASKRGHADVVKLLHKHKASIKMTTREGWQPIHVASYHGHYETVKMLIKLGADTDVLTPSGKTPADLAAERSYEDIVQMLKVKNKKSSSFFSKFARH